MEERARNLECGDLSPLSPLDRLVGQAEPRNSGSGNPDGREPELAPSHRHGDKSPPESGDKSPQSKDWPHAPVHKFLEGGIFFVTAGTLHKEHLFRGSERLTLLESKLLSLARHYDWHLEAWAVFPNHYHFVARTTPASALLNKFLKHLHADTAREINRLDNATGRQVWFNFRDTELTFERSYLARLNYVHQNAVKHGLVPVANQYRWCSAAWLERVASAAMVKTIYDFKTDLLKIPDDY
ncbi:MAG TPA: transposase [Methylomirabilota bacterium]|nr:transposase [Methylomirabilota bacterium]